MEAIAVIVLLGASVLWGLTWWPLKYIHELGFDGVPITLFVYLTMFLLLLPYAWRYRHEIRPHWKILGAICLLGGGAQLVFNTAMIYGDVIRVMVLFYLLPLWGVIGGRLFLSETITPLRWLGMGFSIIGAFLVVGGMHAFIAPPNWIDGLALLSGFLFAMNNIAFRVSAGVPVMLKLVVMFMGSVILASITVSIIGTPVVPEVSASAWWVLLAYAAIWVMLANLGTQWAVTHMEAGKSSIIIIMELVTAVVTASWLLDETLSPLEMVGGLLILTAAFLEARPSKTDAKMHHK